MKDHGGGRGPPWLDHHRVRVAVAVMQGLGYRRHVPRLVAAGLYLHSLPLPLVVDCLSTSTPSRLQDAVHKAAGGAETREVLLEECGRHGPDHRVVIVVVAEHALAVRPVV